MDTVFPGGGSNLGPPSLSRFLFDSGPETDYRTFSQLLLSGSIEPQNETINSSLALDFSREMMRDSGLEDFQFRENWASSLMDAQMPVLTVPSGVSTASFHHSPSFPPGRQSLENPDYPQISRSASFSADKPAVDGYNWRKYGQKPIKCSSYPRSYYKCANPNCHAKKQLEYSLDGHVSEILYKGQHNHPLPPDKHSKDAMNPNLQPNTKPFEMRNSNKFEEEVSDHEPSQITSEHMTLSGSECGDGSESFAREWDDDEPDSKRRKMECRDLPDSSHGTFKEPKIIVHTLSEVDLLDDGYKWRKYGQKLVKGNPYPRSYYKCTHAVTECKVRKHVGRDAKNRKAVVTTYEGKHNHDVPSSKTGSRKNMPRVGYNSID